MIKMTLTIFIFVFCLSDGYADVQHISDEAMRHLDRGRVAAEMAKSPADYEDAIKEFQKAVGLAPDWADAHYNLGLVQEQAKQYSDAAKSFKRYLQLAPDATDAEAVKRHINRLEYKAEMQTEEADLPAKLVGNWWTYRGICNRPLPIQFLMVNGHLSVRYAGTYNTDTQRYSSYKKNPVEIEGKTVKFRARPMYVIPGLRKRGVCDVRFELKLTDPNTLHGKVVVDGDSSEVTYEKTSLPLEAVFH